MIFPDPEYLASIRKLQETLEDIRVNQPDIQLPVAALTAISSLGVQMHKYISEENAKILEAATRPLTEFLSHSYVEPAKVDFHNMALEPRPCRCNCNCD